MLSHPALPRIAARLPRLFSGRRLHRLALHASYVGRDELAERLFEAAAGRYRSELRVERLACLRVHQHMTRVRADAVADRSGRALEIERKLACLDTIESIEPPFAPVEARSLLALWLGEAAGASRQGARAA